MKMKKLIGAAFVALAAAVPSFAAVELGAGFQMTPYNSVKVEDADGVYEAVPFGFKADATFYFGEIRPFSIGLNIGLGYDYFKWLYDSSLREIHGGFNSEITVGPAFRFAVPGTRSSFFVSPGFKFNFMGITTEEEDAAGKDWYDVLFAFEFGFHVDACYTFWVVQNERFGLGLDFGADYSLGFGRAGNAKGAWKDDGNDIDVDWLDVEYAHHLKVYTGVTFRLGK
ncbi:MAG: hypothetical protein K2H09_02810 [Treponemataceae bacterium]|nr:hypothetical protein [Treponemataceae bacterium]